MTTKRANKPKRDVYQDLTDRVIEMIERGVTPWRKPWKGGNGGGVPAGMPHNATTGRPYRGINVALLMMEAQDKGYSSTGWVTPKQAMAAGLNIKGTRTSEIVFWKKLRITDKDASTGEEEKREIMMARTYRVLNLDQCTEEIPGSKAKLKGNAKAVDLSERTGSELAEELAAGLQVSIDHRGDHAFYAPSQDAICVPPVEAFTSDAGYRGTLLHEATHATGAAHRLDRDLRGRFGSESYAAEELVAELGATYLQAMLGVDGDLECHASYLDNWLKVLRSDKKAIFTAASKAQHAADYILQACGWDAEQEEQEEEAVAEAA